MALILNIETSGPSCSVAIAREEQLIASQEITEPRAHSAQLTSLILSGLKESNLTFSDLDAIAVNGGPGSYTGIRIGVGTAKGLCQALHIPLISINTLQLLASLITQKGMISATGLHARLNEFYFAIYDDHLNPTIEPCVATDDEIREHLKSQESLIVNDALGILVSSEVVPVRSVIPSAIAMVSLSHAKFMTQQFENTTSFAPSYLKQALPIKHSST